MAIDSNLLSLFRTLMSSYDDEIQTTDGSDFYSTVIFPLLTRVGGDVLDANTEEFIASYLGDLYPELDVSEFSGIRDLVIRPLAVMLEPFKREVKAVKIAQSLRNVDMLTEDEINNLLANFFIEKTNGEFAVGDVRVYFNAPIDVNTSGAAFFTESGLEFLPLVTTSITSTQMSFNVDGGLFYMDVPVQAVLAGTEYNLPANTITVVENIDAAVSCSNLSPTSSGKASETNQEAVQRAKDSITVQNMVTKSGIKMVLQTNYPNVTDITVKSFGDAEMLRDLVEGPSLVSGVPGGFIHTSSPDVTSTGIHIGGKTDVYTYCYDTSAKTSKTLNVKNITDTGFLVIEGQSGYVVQPANGNVQKFYDDNGFFDRRGLLVGDVLHYSDRSFPITVVAAGYVSIDTSNATEIPVPLEGLKYAITRRSMDGRLRFSLHNLSAKNADGTTATSGSTPDAVVPIPGDPALLPLTSGGSNVAKSENMVSIVSSSSDGNVLLPLYTLDEATIGSGSGAYADLGQISLGEVLEVTAPSGFTGADGASGIAKGKLRVYLRDKANIMGIHTSKYTTNTSASNFTSLSPLQNPVVVDAKKNLPAGNGAFSTRMTGPIYKKDGFLYGVEPIGPISGSADPFVMNIAHPFILDKSSNTTDLGTDTGTSGCADGNYIYLQKASSNATTTTISGGTPNIWPPAAGMWVKITNTNGNVTHRQEFVQIVEVRSVGSTKGGHVIANGAYRCRLRVADPLTNAKTIFTHAQATAQTTNLSVDLFQGFLGESLAYDSNYGLYYCEFSGYCLNSNSTLSNISSASEVTLSPAPYKHDSSQSYTMEPFDSKDLSDFDFYVEGYKLRSRLAGYAYSHQDEPYIVYTEYVTVLDSNNTASTAGDTTTLVSLTDDPGNKSYNTGLTYSYANKENSIQTDFVDLDQNRIVGEDILIKTYLPTVIYGNISGRGITSADGTSLVKTYIENIESSNALEISDLISHLYTNNASYVRLPIRLFVIHYDQNRKITGERVEDVSTLSTIERFSIIDNKPGTVESSVTFTEEV